LPFATIYCAPEKVFRMMMLPPMLALSPEKPLLAKWLPSIRLPAPNMDRAGWLSVFAELLLVKVQP